MKNFNPLNKKYWDKQWIETKTTVGSILYISFLLFILFLLSVLVINLLGI